VQLVLVEASPLGDERKRTVGERPGEQLAVQIDRGDLARVPAWKCGRACTPSFQYIQIAIP
jgi:hypothetical protein